MTPVDRADLAAEDLDALVEGFDQLLDPDARAGVPYEVVSE